MSQITTCPSCGTRFRVVADQLRISDGWVRCGQCQEVFDATLSLQQVPDAPPVMAAPQAPATAVVEAVPAPPLSVPDAEEPASAAALQADVPAAAELPAPPSPVPEAPAPGYELPSPTWDDDAEIPPEPEPVPTAVPDPLLSHAPGAVETEPTLTLSDVVETVEQQWPELGLGWRPAEPQLDEAVAPPAHAADAPGEREPAWVETAADADVVDVQATVVADEAWWDAASAPAVPPQDAPPPVATEAADPEAEPAMGEAVADPASMPAPVPEPVLADAPAWPETEQDAVAAAEAAGQSQIRADAVLASDAEPLAAASGWAPSEMLPPGTEPNFVREARRKAWWQKPAVRLAMGALVVLLPCALVLQVALHERSTLVAWQPGWRPVLQAMCTSLRCEIAPRQDIEAVVVSGSSFTKDAQPQRYQLGLSIQNQSRMAVAVPAVELTLTDAQDQSIVRRVLLPQELGAPSELAGRAEWTTTVAVQTEGLGLQVAGYRVLVFYP